MKKILFVVLTTIFLMAAGWFAFIYYVPYSKGTRAGELIKFSNKGILFKTWEGEISQGISGAQIFHFSVLDKEEEVIEALNTYQGQYVKVEYIERFGTFSFWGDTKYFITSITPEKSPHFNK